MPIDDFSQDQHSHNSSLREIVVEHLFIGNLLKLLWRRGITDAEILRSEFDGYGYDLVLSHGDLVRHIQMKSGTKPPSRISVAKSLASKPSACVIFVQVDDDLNQGPYFWFGAPAGERIGDLDSHPVPVRATHNSQGERPPRLNHRQLKRKDFELEDSFDGLAERLLGIKFSR